MARSVKTDLDLAGNEIQRVAPRIATVTPSSAIATMDLANADVIRITLTDASTELRAQNGIDGKAYRVELTQGSGGGKAITAGTGIDIAAATRATLSALPDLSGAAAGEIDIIGLVWNSGKSAALLTAQSLGF